MNDERIEEMHRNKTERIKHVNDVSYTKKSLVCSSEMSRLPVRAAIRKKRVGQRGEMSGRNRADPALHVVLPGKTGDCPGSIP